MINILLNSLDSFEVYTINLGMPRLRNPNHEKLAKEYVKEAIANNGKVIKTQVYHAVYKNATRESARSTAPGALANPLVKARIDELIAFRNPPEAISADLAELRQATKDHVTATGQIIEIRDNTTRLGAIQTVLKVTGAYNDQPVVDQRSVTFNIEGSQNSPDVSNTASGDKVNSLNGEKGGVFNSLSHIIEKLGALTDRLNKEPGSGIPLA